MQDNIVTLTADPTVATATGVIPMANAPTTGVITVTQYTTTSQPKKEVTPPKFKFQSGPFSWKSEYHCGKTHIRLKHRDACLKWFKIIDANLEQDKSTGVNLSVTVTPKILHNLFYRHHKQSLNTDLTVSVGSIESNAHLELPTTYKSEDASLPIRVVINMAQFGDDYVATYPFSLDPKPLTEKERYTMQLKVQERRFEAKLSAREAELGQRFAVEMLALKTELKQQFATDLATLKTEFCATVVQERQMYLERTRWTTEHFEKLKQEFEDKFNWLKTSETLRGPMGHPGPKGDKGDKGDHA